MFTDDEIELICEALSARAIELICEALSARAARLESYGRANPESAGPNDRKAAEMRKLRNRLRGADPELDWLKKFVRQNVDEKGGNC